MNAAQIREALTEISVETDLALKMLKLSPRAGLRQKAGRGGPGGL